MSLFSATDIYGVIVLNKAFYRVSTLLDCIYTYFFNGNRINNGCWPKGMAFAYFLIMSSEEFNHLGYHEKTEAVLNGTFLADRLTDNYYIKLYNVESFYVEVFFDDQSHLITDFSAFEHTLFVLPYLEDLKIAV
jgi:hypothetical protein